MLRSFGFRPEGAEQISPGQRPGNGSSRGKRALKGGNKRLAMLRPYGLGRMRCNDPRAMPGADLWLPIRGESARSPLQIRWLLNDVAEFRDAPMRAPDRRLSLRERMDPFAERKATMGGTTRLTFSSSPFAPGKATIRRPHRSVPKFRNVIEKPADLKWRPRGFGPFGAKFKTAQHQKAEAAER